MSRSKKTYFRVVQNVQLIGCPPRALKTDEPAITFTNEDARRLYHHHDDVIVINLMIANYTTRTVLVDNKSSVNIHYYPAFQYMKIDKELLHPTNVPVIGFRGTKVLPVGTISLPVVLGSYPQQITKEMNFLVVDCLFLYTAIIGQLALNS